jgi:adenosine deaminase
MFVDLHVHLRGTLLAGTAERLSARNSIAIPAEVLARHGYGWHDFRSFLTAYDNVTAVISTALDLEEVTYEYLSASAACGTIYIEFMLSPPDLIRRGIAFDDQLQAIQAAADRAREESGIECRLIATAVRHLGPKAALKAVNVAVSRRTDILVGFGLTGDERCFNVKDFAESFRIARSEGLQTTAHSGEHLGPETIIEAIETLGLDRVGHGVRAIESPSVVRQLAEAAIPLEICLTSNLALGLYASIDAHPLPQLEAAGCTIVLGTDDPAFFGTNPALEYARAKDALGDSFSTAEISSQAIASAFCNDVTKKNLRRRLDDLRVSD